MSLRYAILTGLNERPATGLELARRFDRSIGYFWPASHQQIYRDIDRLERDAWIEEMPQEGPPLRGQPRRFAITDAGREALTLWVEHEDEPTATRDALLVRVRAASVLGPGKVRGVLAKHLEVHESTWATYRAVEDRDFAGEDQTPTEALLHLVLRRGIETEEGWVRWCREALEVIDRRTWPEEQTSEHGG